LEKPGKTRQIIHIDLDAFYCAVEEQLDPSLKGRPFAVGGNPNERGVVSSCSYAARRRGIHSAMPMGRAIQVCPELLIVSSKFTEYRQASRKVMAYLRSISSLMEQISVDEAFLDVSSAEEEADDIGRKVQSHIQTALRLPCSLGLATNKLVAKIANDFGKGANQTGDYPNAFTLVPPGEEASFLSPLPVRMLWGVGPKSADRLAMMGVRTIGDLARMPGEELVRHFGKVGWELERRSKGIDNRSIVTTSQPRSISQERTFSRDINDEDLLRKQLKKLSFGVARQLRKKGYFASTVKLKLRWSDFSTISRQLTLHQITQDEEEIAAAAKELFTKAWIPHRNTVRLLGVGVSGLQHQVHQLSLWDNGVIKEQRLIEALHTLEERFGDDVVTRGWNESFKD
jgi:DNA polymerase IV